MRVQEPTSVAARVLLAVAASCAAGFVTGLVTLAVLHARHVGCDYVVGGEAGDGTWLCPDGIAYFLPTTAAGLVVGASVLLVYLAREVRRADAGTLLELSVAATLLGSGVVGLCGLWLLSHAPLWFAAPFLLLAAGTAAVRRAPDRLFVPVVAIAAVLGAGSVLLVFTAPFGVAAAGSWLAALGLRWRHRQRARQVAATTAT